jgi:putative ABC transport system ATP-binding protein
LERVGLSDRINHRPAQLSGGQSQRVAIARALVGGPSLILADEPTGSLDSETAVEIMRLFKELNASSTVTIIIVTHDNNVAKFCDRHIRVRDGLIIGDDGGA